jgi:hypothetical protein
LRFFARGERVFHREGVFVDRPTHDNALQRQGGELADVVQRADAAGGDDGDVRGLGEVAGGLDVRAGHHAVGGDVGVDDRGQGPVAHAAGDVDGVELGGVLPSADGELAALGVEPEHEPAAVAGVAHELFEPAPVLKRRRAEHDAFHADGEKFLDRPLVPHAAPDLDAQGGVLADGLDVGQMLHSAGACAIEVHRVQPLAAGVFESASLVERVLAVGGLPVVVALGESNDLAAAEIDGGEEIHGRSGE